MRRAPLFLTALAFAACEPQSAFTSVAAEVEVFPAAIAIDPLWSGAPRVVEVSVANVGAVPVALADAAVVDIAGPVVVDARGGADALAPGARATWVLTISADVDVAQGAAATFAFTVDGARRAVPIVVRAAPIPDCDDGEPCTVDAFDAALGGCVHDALGDGAPCDDGNACTDGDRCLAATCTATPITCDDGVACTVDACDPDVGCEPVPVNDRCDDGDPCTDDVCGAGGCANQALPDGTLCLYEGCANMGLCAFGACVEMQTPDGVPCEDGDPCTAGDACRAGTCAPGVEEEIGAAPPVVLPGTTSIDLCLGDDGFGCWGWPVEATLAEVLAVEAHADGTARLLWRTGYVDAWGSTCVPGWTSIIAAADRANPDAPPPPPEEDEAPGAAMPQQPPRCGAGVMETTLTPGFGTFTASTQQLTTTHGPTAAVARPVDVGGANRTVVASLDYERGDVVVELFAWSSPQRVRIAGGAGSGPSAIAVDADADGAVVAFTGSSVYANGPSPIASLLFVDGAPGAAALAARVDARLAEDAAICDEVAPYLVDDLAVRKRGAAADVVVLAPADACGGDPLVPFAFGVARDDASPLHAPLAQPGARRIVTAAPSDDGPLVATRAAPACVCATTAPCDCPAVEDEGVVDVALVDAEAPGVGVVVLWEGAQAVDRAVPVRLRGVLGAAARVDGTLALAFATADGGVVLAAPLPPATTWRDDDLVAARAGPLVAGVADELVPNACDLDCDDCCADPVLERPEARAVVQLFVCGAPRHALPDAGPDEDAGFVDAGFEDAGFEDAGFDDAGSDDAGVDDAGADDGGFADAGDGG